MDSDKIISLVVRVYAPHDAAATLAAMLEALNANLPAPDFDIEEERVIDADEYDSEG